MHNRQALEDAVFSAYPELDMPEIERMPSDKLKWMLEVKTHRHEPEQPRPRGRPTKPAATVWRKVASEYAVRDSALVHVETWRVENAAGENLREYVQPCGERVWFEKRMVSASVLRHFLLTGQWVKRAPKPRRYRAVVRVGSRTQHLGYFATKEDRDAAVFAWKLGVYPLGQNNS